MKHGMRMKTGIQKERGIQMERGIRRKRGGLWRRWLAGLLAAVMLAELVPVYAREDVAAGQAAERSQSVTLLDREKNTSGQSDDQAVTLARGEGDSSNAGGADAAQTKNRAAADAAGA